MPTTLTARRLLTPEAEIPYPRITIADGLIQTIESTTPNDETDTLTAPFLDIHVHGARSHDFMAATQPRIAEVGRFLATKGVAHYLPTTVTGPLDQTLRALETLAEAIEAPRASQTATPIGIHLEGPFISHSKRGVHPEASLLTPTNTLFDRLQQAARGHIRLITLAPELSGALDLIRHATSNGVRISLGHSNATAAETLAAIAAGATSATHLFNAMRPLDHREPGILGTILDTPALYAEAICDGIHLDPTLIRLWLRLKGDRHAILITDGMSATGMPDGTYTLGNFPVEVTGGVCLSNGTLAGSVLTMDKAVANLQRFTGAPLATAVHLAGRNPAAMLGLPDLSPLTPGTPATFNRFNQAGQLTATILHGETIGEG